MINPNELRLGNCLAYNDGSYGKVFSIEKDDIGIEDIKSPTYESVINLHPIPLTEEVLLKCGFEWSIFHQAYHFNNGFKYVIDICVGFCRVIKYRRNGELINKIDYLHQLQNLYFDLTSNELDVSKLLPKN